MKTLVELAAAAAVEMQVPSLASIAGKSDTAARRFQRYANKAVDLVARAADWSELRKEHVFTASSGSTQSALPADFGRMVPRSFYDRTNGVLIRGPVHGGAWQRLSTQSSWPSASFTIRGGVISVLPGMDGDETLAFEYISAYPVMDVNGVYKASFTQDSDINILDDELVVLAMVADWLAAEGQPFEMPLLLFRQRFARLASQDNPTDGEMSTGFPTRFHYDIVSDWMFG